MIALVPCKHIIAFCFFKNKRGGRYGGREGGMEGGRKGWNMIAAASTQIIPRK